MERLSTPQIDCCSGLHGGGLVEPLASLLHDSLSIILATNSEKHSLTSRVARKSLLERCQEIRSRLECLSPARGLEKRLKRSLCQSYADVKSLGGLLAGLVDDKSNGLEVCWPFPSVLTAASFMDGILIAYTGGQVIVSAYRSKAKNLPTIGALGIGRLPLSHGLKLLRMNSISRQPIGFDDLGVDLPLFFNRHQPNVEAIFNPTANYSLDFNSLLYEAGSSGQWRPPSLGPSYLVF